MPPKKKPSNNEESTGDPSDPIAEATNSLLGDRPNAQSRNRENAQSRNSTISPSHDGTVDPSREATGRNAAGGADSETEPPVRRTEEASSSDGGNGRAGSEKSTTEKDRLPGPYVPTDVSYALQEIQLKLRRMTGEKVSQSLVIQCALEICIEDFRRQGAESALAALVRERSS
jgi:hypothetical protein